MASCGTSLRSEILAMIVLLQVSLACIAHCSQVDSGDLSNLTGYDEARAGAYNPLSLDYYAKSCPKAADIIRSFIHDTVSCDRSFAPAALRLHFHDCFVHGCDGSVLINSPPNATNTTLAEKDGIANAGSLRGFDKVDELKALLEAACPGVVSCADILALSARDAVAEVGGKPWVVPLGRKDGLVSSASQVPLNIPSPFFNFSELVQNFAVKNLSTYDMTVLSGAHTFGRAHCISVIARLYNSTEVGAVGGTDPDLDPKFGAELKKECPAADPFAVFNLDPTRGNNTFDKNYFSRVLAHKGNFRSDAALLKNPQAAATVTTEAGTVSNIAC